MEDWKESKDLEFAFSFKAGEIKFNRKSSQNISVDSNKKMDTYRESYSKNLPQKFRENLVYFRVEKKSILSLKILD